MDPNPTAAQRLLKWAVGVDAVKCYFYARSHRLTSSSESAGVIAFAIPDLGLTYREAIRATGPEFHYRALMLLVTFLETNRKVWEKQRLEICTDSAPLIYQILGDMAAPSRIRPYLGTARIKKRQLGFTLHWVPEEENRARENIVLQPVANPGAQLNFSSFQSQSWVQRAAAWKSGGGFGARPKM